MTNITDYTRAVTSEDILQRVGNNKKVTKELAEIRNNLGSTQATLADFMDVTIGSIEDLQDQIDGNITTYYYSGVPTLSNLPASEWITDEEKNRHLGDLYYDKDTGYAYRFYLDSGTGVYGWTKLTDSDVTEALARANAAQDTADSKRRIFVVQPTPPYDIGDMWITSDKSLYRCQTSASTGSFNPAHWIEATKYTDDTVANEAKNIANQTKTSLETNYSTTAEVTAMVDAVDLRVTGVTTKVETIEDTIERLAITLDNQVIVVSTDSYSKPITTTNYDVNYSVKFDGTAITLQPTTSSSYTGITCTIDNAKIRFSVDSATAITTNDNKYAFVWTYTSSGTTFTITKYITLSVAKNGSNGTSGSVIRYTPYDRTTTTTNIPDSSYTPANANVGDYILSKNGLYFRVTGRNVGLTYVSYQTTVKGEKGDTGDTGAAGQDGEDGKDAAIMSDTPPLDTEQLWFDTTTNQLRRYDSNTTEWVIVNDFGQAISDLGNSVDTKIGEVNDRYDTLNTRVTTIVNTDIADLQVRTNSINMEVTNIQDTTYTIQDINNIVSGNENAPIKVTSVVSSDATFDINGMHYNKTNAPTSTTINELGMKVNKKQNNIEGEELLFAGYVNDSRFGTIYQGDSIVYTKNLVASGYANVGTHGRFESYDGPDDENGVGFFITGGN